MSKLRRRMSNSDVMRVCKFFLMFPLLEVFTGSKWFLGWMLGDLVVRTGSTLHLSTKYGEEKGTKLGSTV